MLSSKGEGSQTQILQLIPIQGRLPPSDLQPAIRLSKIAVAARIALLVSGAGCPKLTVATGSKRPKADTGALGSTELRYTLSV